MHAFPFNDDNIQESEARRNIGDLFLLAARDMLTEHQHRNYNILLALRPYDGAKGKCGGTTTYDELTQMLERDVRFMKKEHGAYPWWDGELFTEWLHRSGYYEQIGALVDTYYGSY